MSVRSSVLCSFFYLIYVLNLFNSVDDVMLRNSCGLSIRGLARTKVLSTNMLGQERLKCGDIWHILTARKVTVERRLDPITFSDWDLFLKRRNCQLFCSDGSGNSPSEGGPANAYCTADPEEGFRPTIIVFELDMPNKTRHKFRNM